MSLLAICLPVEGSKMSLYFWLLLSMYRPLMKGFMILISLMGILSFFLFTGWK